MKAECPYFPFIISAVMHKIPLLRVETYESPKALKNANSKLDLFLRFDTYYFRIFASRNWSESFEKCQSKSSLLLHREVSSSIPGYFPLHSANSGSAAAERKSCCHDDAASRAFEKWSPGREMASLEVDDAQRTLLPRDFTSNVGETQSERRRLPPVEASPNVSILGEKQSGRNSSNLRSTPLQLF